MKRLTILEQKANLEKYLIESWGYTYKQVEEWKEFDDVVDINDFSLDLFKEEEQRTDAVLNLPKEFATLTNKKIPRSALFAMKYLRDRGLQKKVVIGFRRLPSQPSFCVACLSLVTLSSTTFR